MFVGCRAELLKLVEIPQVQFLDKVVFMPVACGQFWGPDVQKTENSGGSAVAVLPRWPMSLLVQFIV